MAQIRDPDTIARRVSDALTRGPIRVDRSLSGPGGPPLCAASPTPGPDRVYYWVLYHDTGPAAIVVAARGRTTLVPRWRRNQHRPQWTQHPARRRPAGSGRRRHDGGARRAG
jgi:hypothetical protein